MKKVLFLMNLRENTGEWSPAIFNWYGVLEKLGYQVFYEDYRSYNPDEFYELVKQNTPDYIFHPTYDAIHPEFIKLRQFSKVYCIHSDDDWRFDNYAKYWIPFTDGAVGYQNTVKSYLDVGSPENYYFRARYTFNPNTMKFDFKSKKIHSLTHVGGLHGGKGNKIKSLESLGLNITCIDPKFSSYSMYLEAFHTSKMSLCFTNNSLGTAPQSKTRLAELPYYCILLSEWWPDMELWNMEPGEDFIMLDDRGDFLELVNKVLSDNDFYKKMFNSAKNILINKNTVFHEWDKIMKHIDEDYVGTDVNNILKLYNLL